MMSVRILAPDATPLPPPFAAALDRIGITALDLRACVLLSDGWDGRGMADPPGPVARAVGETRSNLQAMSRYCLQQLLPRLHGVTQQAAPVAAMIARAARRPASNPAADLVAIASGLERCGLTLREQARSLLRVTALIRMSEQRLWGALASELQRIEGTDGPIMRACARIETLALDLANAADAASDGAGSLPRRHTASAALIRAAWLAGRDADPAAATAALPGRHGPRIRTLIADLAAGHHALRDLSPVAAQALRVATRASAHTLLTSRLEDIFRDLDRLIATESAICRKLARNSGPAAGRAQLVARLAGDARHWPATLQALEKALTTPEATPHPAAAQQAPVTALKP